MVVEEGAETRIGILFSFFSLFWGEMRCFVHFPRQKQAKFGVCVY